MAIYDLEDFLQHFDLHFDIICIEIARGTTRAPVMLATSEVDGNEGINEFDLQKKRA